MTISRTRLSADDSSGIKKAVVETTPGIDEIPQGTDYKTLFANEAFMNEWVPIVLLPSSDPSEVGVPVSVNGRRVYIIPGQLTKVPRTHIAQLVKARPDTITHQSNDYGAPESQQNRMYRQSTSRYNFDVVNDSAQGIAWLRELRQHYFQK